MYYHHYIIFYSFVEENTGQTRFARAALKLEKALTSSDLLNFEIAQTEAGDSRAVTVGVHFLGVWSEV